MPSETQTQAVRSTLFAVRMMKVVWKRFVRIGGTATR